MNDEAVRSILDDYRRREEKRDGQIGKAEARAAVAEHELKRIMEQATKLRNTFLAIGDVSVSGKTASEAVSAFFPDLFG